MSGDSHGFRLMRAAYEVPGLDEHERAVLVLLALRANEQGQCWPSIAHMVEKTGKSERTIQRAIKRLSGGEREGERLHLITQRQRRHDSALYTVHLDVAALLGETRPVTGTGVSGTGDTETPVSDEAKPRQSDTVTTKNNHTPVQASPSQGRRARGKPQRGNPMTMIVPNFRPDRGGPQTAAIVNDWPSDRLDAELEKFVAHHTAKATRSADWQASWRIWVLRSASIDAEASASRGGRFRGGHFRDPLLNVPPRRLEMEVAFNDVFGGDTVDHPPACRTDGSSGWAGRPGMEGVEPGHLDD